MDVPSWLPFLATVAVNLIVVAYLFGVLRADVKTLQKTVEKLCGEHDDIIRHDEKIKEHEAKLEWGTRRFNEIFAQLSSSGAAGRHVPRD
jgi:hypothetical protein